MCWVSTPRKVTPAPPPPQRILVVHPHPPELTIFIRKLYAVTDRPLSVTTAYTKHEARHELNNARFNIIYVHPSLYTYSPPFTKVYSLGPNTRGLNALRAPYKSRQLKASLEALHSPRSSPIRRPIII